VIEAAAQPSVLAGVQGGFSSRRLFEHNLVGLGNVLELCKATRAGLLLLSSSRVYSIPALQSLPLRDCGNAFSWTSRSLFRAGSPPRASAGLLDQRSAILYGSTKLAAEALSLEWGAAFGFPCGWTAAASWPVPGNSERPTRDLLLLDQRPSTEAAAALHRFRRGRQAGPGCDAPARPGRLAGFPDDRRSGGRAEDLHGRRGDREFPIAGATHGLVQRRLRSAPSRARRSRAPYDVPWVAMDNEEAERDFGWRVETPITSILEEIGTHAQRNPDWLERSGLVKSRPEPTSHQPLELLSVVIPCRNEEDAVPPAVEHLYVELRLHGVPHEIVAVDDASTDSTWPVLEALCQRVPPCVPYEIRGRTVLEEPSL